MNNPASQRLAGIAILISMIVGICLAEERTWTDASGKFSINAEFVRVDGDKVVLRRADGKEIKVPQARLSDADKEFLKLHSEKASTSSPGPPETEIAGVAARFYSNL